MLSRMKRREFLVSSAIGAVGAAAFQVQTAAQAPPSAGTPGTRKILISGGSYGEPFIRYLAELTGKPRPKLLYLPTAAADSPAGMVGWFRNCSRLNVEPSAQETFITSARQQRSWEDVLLSVDGIVCSGGNTLNQQALWKAHGIDVILRQAWERGIVLGGASAGSLCWFEEGTTDSRPKALTTVQCLGFLKGSHSPHYDAEKDRRPLYQKLIGSGELKAGYACDNDAGLYFEGENLKRVVATRDGAKCYYVSVVNGQVVEQVLEPERIV